MAQKRSVKAARPTVEAAVPARKPAAKPARKPAKRAALEIEVLPAKTEAPVVAVTKDVTKDVNKDGAKPAAAATAAVTGPDQVFGALFQFHGYEDLTTAGKSNIDAYIAFSTIVANGMESLGKEVMDYAQSSLQANFAVAKGLMAAKTIEEAIDLHTDHTRSSLDSIVDEAAKLTELSVELAHQAMEPIQARVSETAETLFKPLAA